MVQRPTGTLTFTSFLTFYFRVDELVLKSSVIGSFQSYFSGCLVVRGPGVRRGTSSESLRTPLSRKYVSFRLVVL